MSNCFSIRVPLLPAMRKVFVVPCFPPQWIDIRVFQIFANLTDYNHIFFHFRDCQWGANFIFFYPQMPFICICLKIHVLISPFRAEPVCWWVRLLICMHLDNLKKSSLSFTPKKTFPYAPFNSLLLRFFLNEISSFYIFTQHSNFQHFPPFNVLKDLNFSLHLKILLLPLFLLLLLFMCMGMVVCACVCMQEPAKVRRGG